MKNAAARPDTAQPHGTAAVAALAGAIALAAITLVTTVLSPSTLPLWCAAHGGCP